MTRHDDSSKHDRCPAAYFLAALDLRGRLCLVVGGGAVAARKAAALAQAGAAVTVVAPSAASLPASVTQVRRAFALADLDGVTLVVAATDDRETNASVARLAAERGLLVNAVDDPEASSFITPATLQRGPLQVAVTTGGTCPVLATRVRDRLAEQLGPEYGRLAELLGALRAKWTARAVALGLPAAMRRAAWERVLDLPLLELLTDGREVEAYTLAGGVLEGSLDTSDGVDNADQRAAPPQSENADQTSSVPRAGESGQQQ